jgi:hypothetical protein
MASTTRQPDRLVDNRRSAITTTAAGHVAVPGPAPLAAVDALRVPAGWDEPHARRENEEIRR